MVAVHPSVLQWMYGEDGTMRLHKALDPRKGLDTLVVFQWAWRSLR